MLPLSSNSGTAHTKSTQATDQAVRQPAIHEASKQTHNTGHTNMFASHLRLAAALALLLLLAVRWGCCACADLLFLCGLLCVAAHCAPRRGCQLRARWQRSFDSVVLTVPLHAAAAAAAEEDSSSRAISSIEQALNITCIDPQGAPAKTSCCPCPR
jgi:hypothetical protein